MKTLTILLSLLLLAGCTQSNSNYNAAGSTVPTGSTSGSNAVTISNYAFNPATLTVSAGTTVTWTNMDSVPHTVKGSSFSSPTINQGESYQYTFTTPGTYDYSCSIHPSMRGQVIVQ